MINDRKCEEGSDLKMPPELSPDQSVLDIFPR